VECRGNDIIHLNYCGKNAESMPVSRKSYLKAQSVPGRHGITNIGNSCYLSAAVQCLASFSHLLKDLPAKSALS
jgi:ubiquitin C-terminal hydrolase